ncbi:4'-phosphopantetheinyl transferase family protein [Chromobacterium paludis]|uniref:Enterobactin synthase component D n=1 Tax=Chromobacterium paludis TaxID=2605945 RepID=A0A5C1DCI5_9NEIS|nr:4'-phosphopantetheinyl transferase superfamily protein [Chromobacterium paludis]QEL54113.1 4'-phosphopantetheinyl transferase superfamily protein [Chromobacterium paludis]
MPDRSSCLRDGLALAWAGKLADCWLPPPHALADGACAGIALAKLEQALSGMELAAWLPTELARAARKRQLSFLGGRLCAARALEALAVADAAVGRAVDGLPLWPTGMLGTLTHHAAAAYAAVAPASAYAALGMDSERLARDGAAEAIRAVCCTEAEHARWLARREDTLVETLIFSAKEAGYKAIHRLVKRFVGFAEFEVTALDWAAGRLQLSPAAASGLQGVMRPFEVRFHCADGEVHTLVAERQTLFAAEDGRVSGMAASLCPARDLAG